jgi:N-methylhydantoinase A
MAYRFGVDVGGTFTDFSCFDTERKELFYYKVSSTPEDPSCAIVNGINEILKLKGILPEEIAYLAHGTTVATNALIQKRGGKTALITTKGFKDLLEIGRQKRPSLYNFSIDKQQLLVPGKWICEVEERLLYNGEVYKELDIEGTKEVVEWLKEQQVEAIAVCTLFSYVNPIHEQKIESIIKENFPEAYVSVSHKVTPEFREVPRMSTTVVNAFLGPVMKYYVTNFQNAIKRMGIETDPYITQSNGSIISIMEARDTPVRTALSGPTSGVVAADYIASLCNVDQIITFDMGGTSADISLITQKTFKLSSEKNIEGYTVRIPMVDIETVGAGGGSIAYIDEGGALKVGPDSAGAKPGPAAYNRGGTKPTVTDANIILGRLNPETLLAGRLEIRKELAVKAISDEICSKTGLDVFSASKGVIDVVNSNMARTIRVVSVERGYDIREFTLVAFGGAGPLHACELAQDLGIQHVIIPPSPGTFCSLGLLVADIKYDYIKTHIIEANTENLDKINDIYKALENKGNAFLEKEHIPEQERIFIRQVDARYKMQNYELSISISGGILDEHALQHAIEAFHVEHERNYGHFDRSQPIQFINFRLTAAGKRDKHVLKEIAGNRRVALNLGTVREVYFNKSTGYIKCPIYQKDDLPEIKPFYGPAVIEQMDTTIVIMPGWMAKLDCWGNIRLEYVK